MLIIRNNSDTFWTVTAYSHLESLRDGAPETAAPSYGQRRFSFRRLFMHRPTQRNIPPKRHVAA